MLRDNINNAVKDAMKARDERRVSTLRMMNAAIKNADIEARGHGKEPLNEADLMSLFQKMIKQRQESAELYDKGGRPELAAGLLLPVIALAEQAWSAPFFVLAASGLLSIGAMGWSGSGAQPQPWWEKSSRIG